MNDEPPEEPVIEKIRRQIVADKPRVTRYEINWSDTAAAAASAAQPM